MPGENGVRYPIPTQNAPNQPSKHLSMPSFSGGLFVFCSRLRQNTTESEKTRKCKVLLHLGNSVAFFVDNVGPPELALMHTHSFIANRVPVPPHTSLVLRNGHRTEEPVCV